jgi:phosphoglycerate kinase
MTGLKKSIEDIREWSGKRALVRVDFNVPLDETTGAITDDTRIEETLPTLRYLLERNARVIVMSHLGRPKGKVVDSMRLKPVYEHLKTLLPKTPVFYVPTLDSADIQAAIETLLPGSLLLLENLRFDPREEANDVTLAKELASFADVYVNDAFGAAHRAHASTEGVAHFVPEKVAGLLMQKELKALSGIFTNPQKPVMAIIGGSKVSSKITVLQNLMDKVSTLVVGGGMRFTFYKAMGLEVGTSLVEPEHVETARQLMAQAAALGVELYLPADVVISQEFAAEAEQKVVSKEHIPADWMGLDAGPQTIQDIKARIQASKTILWNGPLGVFEFPRFSAGTVSIAKAIATWTQEQGGISILGGGDTVAALTAYHIPAEQFTHVSTGGGASLEFLEGKVLPGVAILEEASRTVPA